MPHAHGDASLNGGHPGLSPAEATHWDWNKAAALMVVLALHGAVLYGLWRVRLIPHPAEAVTLFVNLINPSPTQPKPETLPAPEPPKPAKPIRRDAPHPIEPPHPRLSADEPVISPADATEPRPPAEPATPAATAAEDPGPPAAPSRAAGPVTLSSHLALACPVRTPPPYPALSRRLGETGKVVLRVELDETGRIVLAQVLTSSGYPRLDAAALAAVKAWRCQPAQRDGQAVRSVAVQPFEFTLEGQ